MHIELCGRLSFGPAYSSAAAANAALRRLYGPRAFSEKEEVSTDQAILMLYLASEVFEGR